MVAIFYIPQAIKQALLIPKLQDSKWVQRMIKRVILTPQVQHVTWITLMFVYIYAAVNLTCYLNSKQGDAEEYESYGILATTFLYIIKIPFFMSFPFFMLIMIGFLMYNPFYKSASINCSDACKKAMKEFVCFRVVTRGMYPDLVKDTVDRNISICNESGISNFIFEVVTDNAINLRKCQEIREIIVPEDYCTSKGTQFKARALNYCLESEVSIYSDDDYVVHLDEESLLTREAIHGIFKFISNGTADIGQGSVVFANGTIVNWLTTFADGFRVAYDYGAFRFSLAFCHRPLLYFKGSYFVLKTATEKAISFDMTPQCSITEDIYFALKGWTMGYTFDFIEGDMLEKSPFSVTDFFKQRGRWCRGLYHVVLNSDIPWSYKGCLSITYFSWMVVWCLVINGPLSLYFPVYLPSFMHYIVGVVLGMTPFSYLIGNYIQMQSRYPGDLLRPLVVALLSQPFVVLFGIMEATIFLVLIHRNKVEFHIVQKDFKTKSNKKEHDE